VPTNAQAVTPGRSAAQCLCCECWTVSSRADYEICPVCFWEDEDYPDLESLGEGNRLHSPYDSGDPGAEALLDVRSAANDGLTLREGRRNYRAFGACVKEMLPHVRAPLESELP
jgi:hypothetical protein